MQYARDMKIHAFDIKRGFPSSAVVKNPPANAGDERDTVSIPGSGRLPWRRN